MTQREAVKKRKCTYETVNKAQEYKTKKKKNNIQLPHPNETRMGKISCSALSEVFRHQDRFMWKEWIAIRAL